MLFFLLHRLTTICELPVEDVFGVTSNDMEDLEDLYPSSTATQPPLPGSVLDNDIEMTSTPQNPFGSREPPTISNL